MVGWRGRRGGRGVAGVGDGGWGTGFGGVEEWKSARWLRGSG